MVRGPRLADPTEVTAALTDRAHEILDQLPMKRVQLSQPLDGGGARIRASVELGRADDLPEAVVVELADGPVRIPLQGSEDYRVIQPPERDTLPTLAG